MGKYNKDNGRKNMRLYGYDYSRAGLYFLTIVVQNRLNLFGHIKNGKMILNDAGRMIEKWYYEIENKYSDKNCHEMVVMPNHFHCIIENMEMDVNITKINDNRFGAHGLNAHVGAPLRGRSETVHPETVHSETVHPETVHSETVHPETDHPEIVHPEIAHPETVHPETDINKKYGLHNKKNGATIGDVMDWFKTMTTNEYIRGVKNNNWRRFDRKLWQRNYYDHIIRTGLDNKRISTYIVENPERWENDKFN